ncbi:MAG: hypothetical protein IKP27_01480 [Paludibacteraceae bacterium]|nr:hypothetical protein [Paludibacteraceae bacterium]
MDDNNRINRLVIIGNGFDLAHGLKTKYEQFIRWYLGDFFRKLFDSEEGSISRHNDELLDIKLFSKQQYTFHFPNETFTSSPKDVFFNRNEEVDNLEFLTELGNKISNIRFSVNSSPYLKKSEFLERILKNIASKGWTDIESDYYALLKENADNVKFCESLNKQMDLLRDKLAEYLGTQGTPKKISGFSDIFDSYIAPSDIASSRLFDFHYYGYIPQKTFFLDFNYTPTTGMYENSSMTVLKIHGSLGNTNSMIFGYGDEMDKDFQELEDRNENELLKNAKSVKYLEDNKYRRLMKFIGGSPYQVFIMGHSCGNSDRTLLHTIFEHENCISIKPFYYKWGENEGDDDYSNIIQNIYRNFKDKTLFRDRVVNKTQCEKMPQMEKKEDENRN